MDEHPLMRLLCVRAASAPCLLEWALRTLSFEGGFVLRLNGGRIGRFLSLSMNEEARGIFQLNYRSNASLARESARRRGG